MRLHFGSEDSGLCDGVSIEGALFALGTRRLADRESRMRDVVSQAGPQGERALPRPAVKGIVQYIFHLACADERRSIDDAPVGERKAEGLIVARRWETTVDQWKLLDGVAGRVHSHPASV